MTELNLGWLPIEMETHALMVPGGALIRTWSCNGDAVQSEALTLLPRPHDMSPKEFEQWFVAMSDLNEAGTEGE